MGGDAVEWSRRPHPTHPMIRAPYIPLATAGCARADGRKRAVCHHVDSVKDYIPDALREIPAFIPKQLRTSCRSIQCKRVNMAVASKDGDRIQCDNIQTFQYDQYHILYETTYICCECSITRGAESIYL